MTELDAVPEDAQLARKPDLKGACRMIVVAEDGTVYDVGNQPLIYTERVGYDEIEEMWRGDE